jgi:hypothetical protein
VTTDPAVTAAAEAISAAWIAGDIDVNLAEVAVAAARPIIEAEVRMEEAAKAIDAEQQQRRTA